jgi:PBP1b-binding outer membrane lipoprotein LpoB
MFDPPRENCNTYKAIITIILAVIILSGCMSKEIAPESGYDLSGTEKILVLAFKDINKIYGEGVSARCPLCGKVFMTGRVSADTVEKLTIRLVSNLKSKKKYKIVTLNPIGEEQTFSERKLIIKKGREYHADAVIAGYVYRYKERIGNRYSVKSPASVAFGIHLISTKSGGTIWSGHFDETQRSLSENLFKLKKFIKRKASWITADEMANCGFEEILGTFPNK